MGAMEERKEEKMMCGYEWRKDPEVTVSEIKENMEMFWEQGVDFWLNGHWASSIVSKSPRAA